MMKRILAVFLLGFGVMIMAIPQIPVVRDYVLPVVFSEQEYADVLANSMTRLLKEPNVDIEKVVHRFDGVTVQQVFGRNIIIGFEMSDEMGSPTILNAMNVTFVRSDGSRSHIYRYTIDIGRVEKI